MCEAMERIEARSEARGEREGKRMLKEVVECIGLSFAQVKKLQAEMA